MRSALKWGALVGLAMYLGVALALTILGNVLFPGAPDLTTNPGKLTFGCLGLFLLLFAFSAAGFLTGRETARAGLGALAGMVAFGVYAVLLTVYSPDGRLAAAPAAASLGAQVAAAITAVVLYLGVAAGMGWLGGRPGAQRARRATPPAAREDA